MGLIQMPTMMEDRASAITTPKIGTVQNGKVFNGKTWLPLSNVTTQLADFENKQSSLYQMPKVQASTTSGGGSYTGGGGSTPVAYQKPELRGGQALADKYGITYGRENIESVLNQATNAKFNELDAGTRKLRDQQLTDYASQYDQYLQYARQNRERALKSGLSRGSAISQDIMSQMAVQKGGAENQAYYQQGLADLVNQRGTQLGADKFNAMSMSNELGLSLGGLDANLYQSDTAGLTGYQQYLASLAQSNAQIQAAQAQANASRYAADRGYAASTGGAVIPDYIKNLGLDSDLAVDVATGKLSATEASNIMKDRKKANDKSGKTGGYSTQPVMSGGSNYFDETYGVQLQ